MRGTYDVVGAARRRRPDDLVARRDRRRRCRRPTRGSGAPRSARTSSRCGRTWRCTGRPSSTRATSRRSSPTRRPRAYVCVYPFVRSYEWYLLPDDERRALLAEHGQMARDYPDVRANTVVVVRARRLRVDARLRGRRAAPHRRPDAAPARLGDPPARARGGAVLHRPPSQHWPSSSPPCRDGCSAGQAAGCVLERQRDRVDAVAQVGRGVVALALEDVAEVAVAVRAQHLGAGHAPAAVGALDDRARRPAG